VAARTRAKACPAGLVENRRRSLNSMLFNSYSFILFFAPITFAGYFMLGAKHRRLAMLWLAMASHFFYTAGGA
jgi:hypothetical protein